MAEITFHVLVTEEDDGSFWAEVKELPGCFASGFSMDELQEAMLEAMQMWLPDGIVLGKATWRLDDEGKTDTRPGAKQRPARQMLVCA